MESIIEEKYSENGFVVIDNVFNEDEIRLILDAINTTNTSKPTFRKSEDLFAIRQFFKEVPQSVQYIFSEKCRKLIADVFGDGYFIVKSIYFDKSAQSNWFVAYHQDLTISVDRKSVIDGYGPWTVKQDQFAVQPPLSLLSKNFTIRIHLDNTDKENGALKVIPGSHLKGIYRPELIDWVNEKEVICHVKAGGVMLMSPLLLHASNRTTNNQKRRVIHIEFSNQELPNGINWSEYLDWGNANSFSSLSNS